MKNVEDVYVASPLQQGLIFHGLLAPESSAYSVQMICDLEGELDVLVFRRAWERVFERHSVLRTCFIWEDVGEVLQVVRKEVELPWRELDWRGMSEDEQEKRLQSLVEQDRTERFEFSQAPLVRISLVRLSEQRAKFVWCHHHSLLDGWSASIVFKDALDFYNALMAGQQLQLPPVRPYSDYIAWLQQQDLAAAERYWRERLKGFTNTSPLIKERRGLSSTESQSESTDSQSSGEYICLSTETTVALKSLSRQHQLTLNTVMQGAWALFLSRYGGGTDVIFGAVVSGRPPELNGVEAMVGLFINTLPVRVRIDEGAELLGWLRQLQAEQVDMRGYEYSPLVAVQGWSDIARGLPLFETMMVFENYPIKSSKPGHEERLQIKNVGSIEKTNYPLSFGVMPADKLVLQLNCDTGYFTKEQVRRMLQHVGRLVEEMAAHPQAQLRELSMLTTDERHRLLYEWNETNAEYPAGLCIHQLYEEQAERTPDHLALVYEEQQLTYRELNERANQLARHLRSIGVGADVLVGICLARSLDMVISLLAVLKAGGAYLPLDPDYPPERLALMLNDAGVTLVLTQQHLHQRLSDFGAEALCVDAEGAAWATESRENPITETQVDNLAYVIYTSGSTGTPKGVCITHRSLVSYTITAARAFQLSELDRVLQFASLSFDASAEEIYTCLSRGATLVLRPAGMVSEPAELMRQCDQWGVTMLDLPTAYWHEVVGDRVALPATARLVVIGGEQAQERRLREWREQERGVRLLNTYGPTEATVVATMTKTGWAQRSDSESRNGAVIGGAVANTRVYVLDRELKPSGIGVAGELYIGGVGVARGYLKRPELTAERFVPDPYSERGGERLYRTGDLGLYLPDGQIEFLGRVDEQVKVRGNRIELGEIEALLLQHPAVHDCIVVVRDDHGVTDKRLVAYVVPADLQQAPSSGELRQHLSRRLPDYMLPQRFVMLEALPLTPNGKIDRRALPAPELTPAVLDQNYAGARTPLEEMIQGIWEEVLGVEEIGIHDNFFELGGHSLLATQVISRVRQGCRVELPLRRLFESPTVAGLSEAVEQAGRSARGMVLPALRRAGREQALPLSFAQQRLWFLDQLEPFNSSYNMAQAVRLTGVLNTAALAQALGEISRRHEVLRTTFVTEAEVPVQVISAVGARVFEVEDLSALAAAEREAEAVRRAGEEAREPFDLSRGPLLRVRVLRLGAEEHALLLTMHHIVSDGWSMGVFMGELTALYEAYAGQQPSPLAELPVQYGDYAVWQRGWLQGAVLEQQLSYWREQLAGAPPTLELATDRPRPAQPISQGAMHYFGVSGAVSEGLQQLSRKQGATLFMTLLAAFQLLLQRYSGQADIVVGAPIAGRNHGETEGLIGLFVNTLVLRTKFSGGESFAQVLEQVKEVCLGAYAHQDVPFEKLVEELQPARQLHRTPLFQVLFSLLNAPAPALELPGLKLSHLEVGESAIKFDLTLTMVETKGELHGAFTYNTDLYEAASIQRMAGHFVRLLEAISQDTKQALSTISMLTPAERQELIVEWNDTKRDYQPAVPLHQLIEAQVERTPEQVAIRYQGEQVTYIELNRRANQLAHYLRSFGVGAETLVGVMVERSVEMVVGLLAILKTGGAYLPLNPVYPPERLSFMLEDAQVAVLITESQLRERAPTGEARVICLDVEAETIARHSKENVASQVAADNLAYVIYTSGSTGTPKGVAITHRSAVVLVHWAGEVFSRAELAGVLASTSICFDLSVFEIFVPLSYGGSIILAENALALPLLREATEVTLINTVPSAMAELVRVGGVPESVRTVNLAGEPLQNVLVQRVYEQPDIKRVLNLYGPSEDTTYSTYSAVEKGSRTGVTIGLPVANTEVYLLDPQMELVPVGVMGEIYLGGEGLARGYVKRAETTAERFVPHLYSSTGGARLYRTGDLGRHLADGRIEYLGRLDQQVKLRGFRIELGEIEAVLSRHSALRDVVVTVREDPVRGKELVAYVVADAQPAPSSGELRHFLSEKLPDYMIPQTFLFLQSLPLTTNGKVDRRALPDPGAAELNNRAIYVGGRTATEQAIVEIWEEVLGVEAIGIDDNFFELGGHSLLATQVISRVRQGCRVELPLRRLFESPTVAGLSEAVEQAGRSARGMVLPALRRAGREQALPLSFAQQRLWFLDQLEPFNSSYNMAQAVRLTGVLNTAALAQALGEISRRHEVLRTTFVTEAEVPVQVISAVGARVFEVEDLSALAAAEREAEAVRRAGEEAREPFDLSRGPLLRVRVLRLGAEEHALLLTMHHIVSDGWSMGVFMGELTALYEAYAGQQPSPLAELPVQYGDYAVWQRGWLQGALLEQQLSYWREQLAGAPPTLELATDRPRPAQPISQGAMHYFGVSGAVSDGLQQLSRKQGATLFMTLLAAFQLLLQRYSGQADIVVGAPIAGRNHGETEGLIGLFVNTLVLRTKFSGGESFAQVLEQVKEVCLGAYAHQDVPFEKLVEELQPARQLHRTPLFQVLFSLLNAPAPALELPGLKLSHLEVGESAIKFDLTLTMVETNGELHGAFTYNTALFDAATMRLMASRFEMLLEAIVAEPQEQVSRLSLLAAAERERLLVEWNETAQAYPEDCCLHELFEAQVERTPHALALVYEDERLTYGELNERANQLAHYLRGLGVGPEVLVGILMERSTELVVALLGVLKAGGAYLPLDPDYPPARLSYMLEDTQARLVLSQPHLVARLPAHNASVICSDAEWGRIGEESTQNPANHVNAANLAYVIYTSGSTGTPKGAMLPHRGVVNCLHWMQETYSLDSSDRFLLKTSLSFDPSIYEVFWPLMAGATIIVARPAGHLDSAYLVETIVREQVTSAYFVPSMLRMFLAEEVERAQSLRLVICGGEELPVSLIEEFNGRLNAKLHHSYGPSETSISVTKWAAQPGHEWEIAPIGRPMGNIQVFILDEQLQPVPLGVAGQLHVGGAGIGRGYLNRPTLTAEKFIPNPFSKEPGALLYRTGDLSRYLNDGNIKFLGRLDQQVKVRGNRIELGEIEALLLRHEAVQDCVVMVRDDHGVTDKRLVAYVAPVDLQQAPSSGELRQHLSRRLPDYMLPQRFVMLEALPLTPNGKIDRRALPAPELTPAVPGQNYAGARTPLEEIVQRIWEEVLGVEEIGIHDNFFELGGHSLLATQVISRLRRACRVELPLRRLFESPTVAGLSEAVEQAGRSARGMVLPALTRAGREQALPLSFAQQRLWFLDQLQPANAAYNIPGAMRLTGHLNRAALEQSLLEIINRHEVLRTSFVSVDGEPVQIIAPETDFQLSTLDFSDLPVAKREQSVVLLCQSEAQRPFDLSVEPLLRATLLKLAEDEHVLLLVMHHIVTDGWSQSILTRELALLYEAYNDGQPSPLPELPIQYADYAAWQREWLQGEVLEQQLSYWRQQLAGVTSALKLSTDRPRPSVPDLQGASTSAWLPEALSQSLNSLSRRQGVTMFMTLLAAFQTLLHRYTGQDDIATGTPIAGRNHTEIEALIGFFVNTLVLRADFSNDPTFSQLLARTREICLDAYAHQDVPFEKLVEELQPERNISHTPLFEVMFVLQNMAQEALKLPGLDMSPQAIDSDTTKYDLTLSVVEVGDRFFCSLDYKTELFDASTIEQMLENFGTLLESVVADPDQRVSRLSILTETEKERLLVDWNRTGRDYPSATCLTQLFEAQVDRTPQQVAINSQTAQLSYLDLNRRANQLAHCLRARGLGPESLVGLMLERSAEMIVALLAVLKCGAAYLPLDLAYPAQRLSFMLDDAQVALLITDSRLLNDGAPLQAAQLLCLDTERDWIGAQSQENLSSEVVGENLAYVIYTSGSTGKPKGVAITHRSALTLVHWSGELFSTSELAGVLASTSICFDLSVFEIFVPLSYGGTVILAENALELPLLNASESVTLVNTVPSAMAELVRMGGVPESVRTVNLAGEPLLNVLAQRLYEKPGIKRVVNLYGPTEDTTYSTSSEVVAGTSEQVTIGRPVAKTEVYVLDKQMELVAVGVSGEIYLGGAGLARGYVNRPEVTAERFVPHRFSAQVGARLYRTGDLGRYLADGRIEYEGRMDEQVKVRGYRIELGEIESVLSQHTEIREAVVVAREDSVRGKELAAYVVMEDGKALPARSEIERYLRERIPEYMIPQTYINMESMPLTTNGKIDRRALPAPDLRPAEREGSFLAPRDLTEFQLVQVWEDILGVQPVSVNDNFFRLGGHSLLAVRMVAQVHKRLRWRIPLAALFEEATVNHLAMLARQQVVALPEPALIPIRTSGTKPPIFFVHPVGGRVFCYMALAGYLDLDRPFYGFQSQVSEGGQPMLKGIEAMAAHYVEELRAVQPEGPYYLGGWSMGGVVAFEMALRLQGLGHEVKLLALVDSMIPYLARPRVEKVTLPANTVPNKNSVQLEEATLLISFAMDLGLSLERLALTPADLLFIEPGQQLTHILEQAREAGVVPADLDLSVIQRLYDLFKNNHRALWSYVPEPYAGKALLIKAAEREISAGLDPALGWDKLIADLEIREVAGTHYTMVREPHVRTLGRQLEEYCSNLEEQVAPSGDVTTRLPDSAEAQETPLVPVKV